MMYCANLSMEDFYVIHHELGHIQYFMAYDEKLPTLFMVRILITIIICSDFLLF